MTDTHASEALFGKRILVVEDDYLLASDICQCLRDRGARVLGPAPTPHYAQSLIGRRAVDVAVLDVRLHGTTVYSLADELIRRLTPVVFATAYERDQLPERFRPAPWLNKPLDLDELLVTIEDLTRAGSGPEPVSVHTPVAEHGVEPERRFARVLSHLLRHEGA
jgi:DNA-binding response OmpR family regulator